MRLRAVLLLCLALLGGGTWLALERGWFRSPARTAPQRDAGRAAPVELAEVHRGPIVDRRVFSGTLEPRAQFTVAPKVAGRIESLHVDIGDEVAPGAVIATLDDDEFEQAVAEAGAELAVSKAQVAQAKSALDVAQSTYDRVTGLQQIEIVSGSELDLAVADLRAREAQVDVAEAQVQRAEAVLAAARVRLRYAQVVASWGEGDAPRLVAQRYLDQGATVAANDPIVTVVDIQTVRAVLYVTERDFARLAVGQPALVRTDAWPGADFAGTVRRLAPVFETASRQMRVEVEVPNGDRRLRPGMFVRVEIALGSDPDAVIVPEAALVRRDEGDGVFVVTPEGDRVRFVPVRTGIVAGDLVQVSGEGVAGRVVTLGQQLLEDGARIHVPGPLGARRAGAPRSDGDAASDG